MAEYYPNEPSYEMKQARHYFLENGADATLQKYPQYKELINSWEAGNPEKVATYIDDLLKNWRKK